MYIANYHRRAQAVFLLFFLTFVFCIARLFFIQFFRSSFLKSLARKQHNQFIELEPRRGNIFDANLKPQAVNIAVDSLYACPDEMSAQDKEILIEKLSAILKVQRPYLQERLGRKKSFIWLARKISPEQSQAIKKLNLKGLGFIR